MGTSSSRTGDGPATSSERGGERRLLAMAVRYSRRGVRSARQVLAHLDRAGASPGDAARVMAECRSRGLVDDEACARLWADHWARRGYAWSTIRLKLSGRGLDEPAIEQAAIRLGTIASDEARARQEAKQYCRRSRRQSTRRQASGLGRALAARGFDPDLIERILNDTFGPREGIR